MCIYVSPSRHAVEVLVNTTQQSASCFILPPHVRVNPDPTTFDPTPTLATTSDPSPTLATTSGLAATSGGASEGGGGALDVVFDGWNMAAIKALLNFLEFKLVSDHSALRWSIIWFQTLHLLTIIISRVFSVFPVTVDIMHEIGLVPFLNSYRLCHLCMWYF